MNSDSRFEIHNDNQVHDGDIIQQYGPGSIGKQVHTGSGDNVQSKTGPATSAPVVVQGGDYVARDKTANQRGDVNHDYPRGSDDGPRT